MLRTCYSKGLLNSKVRRRFLGDFHVTRRGEKGWERARDYSVQSLRILRVHAGIVETMLTAKGLRHLPKAPNERSESV